MKIPSPKASSKEEILTKERLIVALDYASIKEAENFIKKVKDLVDFFKIGMELQFQEGGIRLARQLKEEGKKIFFDAKSFDVPRTVEAAVRSLSNLHFDFMSVHTLSQSVLAALANRKSTMKLIGITLLTSIDEQELRELGIQHSSEALVRVLAQRAVQVGRLDGLVASGKEIADLRKRYPDAILIAPGIRPHGSPSDDQKRISTPQEAIAAGADYIVVGRPITKSKKDPCSVIDSILDDIEVGRKAFVQNQQKVDVD